MNIVIFCLFYCRFFFCPTKTPSHSGFELMTPIFSYFFTVDTGEEGSPGSLSPPPDDGSLEWEFLPPNHHHHHHSTVHRSGKCRYTLWVGLGWGLEVCWVGWGGGRGRGGMANSKCDFLVA